MGTIIIYLAITLVVAVYVGMNVVLGISVSITWRNFRREDGFLAYVCPVLLTLLFFLLTISGFALWAAFKEGNIILLIP